MIIGDEIRTRALADGVFAAGVFAPAIVFPTVPKGLARVRTIVTADHTDEDLDEAVDVFGRVGEAVGAI